MEPTRSGSRPGRKDPHGPAGKRPMRINKGSDSSTVVQFAGRGRRSGHGGGTSGGGHAARLPVIDVGDGNLARVAARAWKAVEKANDPPRQFRHGALPSRLERDDKGPPVIRPLTTNRMRYLLARVATWGRETPEGFKEVYPPMAVVRDMLAHPNPPLPTLTRIVEVPIFAPDGTLCSESGYHPINCIFYAPAKGFVISPMPEQPLLSDIEQARSLILDELLADFPFTTHAERAHAVGLGLLPFVRDLIDGATPLHLFEKPSPGTGATLLVDVLLFPALGHPVPTMSEGGEEEEWRKRITAKLLQGPSTILIDNLRHCLQSSALSAAITAPQWEDRILGRSEIARIPVRCAWAATGNNPTVSNEIARRSVRIRLDARTDEPWRREGFKQSDLRGWVRAHRAELVRAFLILARGWLAAGRPPLAQPKSLGMFEEWATVIGGILSFAGVEGFLGNLGEFYSNTDTEGSAWRSFVTLWFEKHGERPVGVADLVTVVRDHDLFDLGAGSDRSQRTRLGKLIGRQRDRQFGTLRVVAAGEVRGSGRWRLEQVPSISPEK